MSMAKQRRTFTAEQKVGILKRHLLEKAPVSDLCDELAHVAQPVDGFQCCVVPRRGSCNMWQRI
jgi:hypothetical protein